LASKEELPDTRPFPFLLKAAVGTASRGTWIIRTAADYQVALRELAIGSLDGSVLVQEVMTGAMEHAQAVYSRGDMLGFHAWRQVKRGAGGGDAIKESVGRPIVRAHMARLGKRLAWHGALSVDYILGESDEQPRYIDGNPRLVEPMGAKLAGIDLADLLVRVSRNDVLSPVPDGVEGVRTHMAVQALLGHVLAGGTRATLVRECWHLLAKRGAYAGSREELTPVRLDWLSAIAPVTTALWLLADLRAAQYLPKKGWGKNLLNPESIRSIEDMEPLHNGAADPKQWGQASKI
jgi:hypothetical protein